MTAWIKARAGAADKASMVAITAVATSISTRRLNSHLLSFSLGGHYKEGLEGIHGPSGPFRRSTYAPLRRMLKLER
jgi:hypothetical protein